MKRWDRARPPLFRLVGAGDHSQSGNAFPGRAGSRRHPFRSIRDAGIEIQELEADDLLEAMQQSIRRRKFGSVVKVAVYENMPRQIRDWLAENLQVKPIDVYVTGSNLGLVRLWQLHNTIDRHNLKYPPFKPTIPRQFSNAHLASDIFEIIQQENILLHHPYDSFNCLRDYVLETCFKDNTRACVMQPDGTYKRLHPSEKEKGVDIESWLEQNPSGLVLR